MSIFDRIRSFRMAMAFKLNHSGLKSIVEKLRNKGISTDYSHNPCVQLKTLALNEGKMKSMSMVSNVDFN